MHVLEAALFANFVKSPLEALSDRPRPADCGSRSRHDVLAAAVGNRAGRVRFARFRRWMAGEARNPLVAGNVG